MGLKLGEKEEITVHNVLNLTPILLAKFCYILINFPVDLLMFADEYDLAMAVMQGMEARSERGNYSLERFKFNSA